MKFSDTEYGDLTGQDITIPTIRVSKMRIDDLTGSPKIVRGDFVCHTNNLVSLKNSPREIYGFTSFSDNMLESLEGNLETIVGSLNISNNPLKTFKGKLKKVTGILMARRLQEFHSKEEIEDALMEADITIGSDIQTDFGTFRQDPKKIEAFKARYRIDILSEFL